jgi:hypothetical protein
MKGRRVGLVVIGQNIDTPVLAKVLAGETPAASAGRTTEDGHGRRRRR